jgi:hypothetical protein
VDRGHLRVGIGRGNRGARGWPRGSASGIEDGLGGAAALDGVLGGFEEGFSELSLPAAEGEGAAVEGEIGEEIGRGEAAARDRGGEEIKGGAEGDVEAVGEGGGVNRGGVGGIGRGEKSGQESVFLGRGKGRGWGGNAHGERRLAF